jgi:hypothetical protein
MAMSLSDMSVEWLVLYMQGGEEAAALLSQLEAPAGGEIQMNWNIKVCPATAHVLARSPRQLRQQASRSPSLIGSDLRQLVCLTWLAICWQEFLPPAVQPPFQVLVSEFLLQPWREVVAPSAADPAAGSQVLYSLLTSCHAEGRCDASDHARGQGKLHSSVISQRPRALARHRREVPRWKMVINSILQAVVDARSRGARLEDAARWHVERTALPKVHP